MSINYRTLLSVWGNYSDLKDHKPNVKFFNKYVSMVEEYIKLAEAGKMDGRMDRGLCRFTCWYEPPCPVLGYYDFWEAMSECGDTVAESWNYDEHSRVNGPSPERIQMAKNLVQELKELVASLPEV